MSDFSNTAIRITGGRSGLCATAAMSLAGKCAKVAMIGRRGQQRRHYRFGVHAHRREAQPELFATIITHHSAMNRPSESREVADTIAWLLSAQSSFVNSAAIPIDGAETTRLS